VNLLVATSLDAVDPQAWNRLAGDDPFLQYAFLHALHDTGCACAATGWTPQYLLLQDGDTLLGAMPLYLKQHSYGEYVFDWAWADAYQRHGLTYYPKLLCAIPFTPVVGSRILAREPAHRDRLIAGALELANRSGISSLHILFPSDTDLGDLTRHGLMLRQGLQFHWNNDHYTDFEQFLSRLSHDKRKKIRQERRKVRDTGITFDWLEGTAIGDDDWQFFHRCYRQTYREHHSSPYLNLEFFRRIGAAMPESFVLVRALRENRPVAASLLVRNATRLYGRHWGAIEHHPMLHFETCYYQAIEFAIAHGLQVFEGGAQGEHKMARGLLPVATQSAHWLAHPEFTAAVGKYLERETALLDEHGRTLAARNPFKSG
jgi:hypothetical protein